MRSVVGLAFILGLRVGVGMGDVWFNVLEARVTTAVAAVGLFVYSERFNYVLSAFIIHAKGADEQYRRDG